MKHDDEEEKEQGEKEDEEEKETTGAGLKCKDFHGKAYIAVPGGKQNL